MAVVPEEVLKARKAAEEKLEKILSDFEKTHDTATDKPGRNLRDLLDKSPDLKARILDSVQKGHLDKFDVLPSGANAGGTYNGDSKTIALPADKLKNAGTDKSAAAELVFVMGHEIQHSFNSTASDKAVDAFRKDVDRIVKGPGPHDYTAAVKTLIQSYRENEAGAHIGGFNAIASQVMKGDPKAGLKELYNAHPGRMADFIDRSGKAPNFTYAMKPGLTLEADNTLKSTPENVKAMGKHYFDQPPSSARLGTKGNQDYPNYYGEWALGVIERAEKRQLEAAQKLDPKATAPEVRLDLKDIGLKASLLDTGLKYTDSSPKKPITQALDSAAHEARHPAPDGREPALYGQAMQALGGVQGQLGILDRTELRNTAAAVAAQAQTSGLERIDGALVGRNGQVFFYQGDPASEHADRIAVDVNRARQQPAAESLATLAAETPQQTQAPQTQQRGPNL